MRGSTGITTEGSGVEDPAGSAVSVDADPPAASAPGAATPNPEAEAGRATQPGEHAGETVAGLGEAGETVVGPGEAGERVRPWQVRPVSPGDWRGEATSLSPLASAGGGVRPAESAPGAPEAGPTESAPEADPETGGASVCSGVDPEADPPRVALSPGRGHIK